MWSIPVMCVNFSSMNICRSVRTEPAVSCRPCRSLMTVQPLRLSLQLKQNKNKKQKNQPVRSLYDWTSLWNYRWSTNQRWWEPQPADTHIHTHIQQVYPSSKALRLEMRWWLLKPLKVLVETWVSPPTIWVKPLSCPALIRTSSFVEYNESVPSKTARSEPLEPGQGC